MSLPQDDCRVLVLVRPTKGRVSLNLEGRLKAFIATGAGTEGLDEKTFSSLHGNGQIADYLLWNRQFIAEMKSVNGYPADRISRLVSDCLRAEPRMFVVGSVGIQRILADREDGDETNHLMVTVGGRPVRKLLRQADPQIAATRAKFQLPDAAGLAIILIDAPQKVEAGVAAYAVREALNAQDPRLDEIDFVWVSMEAHTVRLPSGELGFPELVIWRANRRSEADRLMMGKMLDAWASFNGVEMEHLDHTTGWETLNPVGEGWPLTLSVY